MNNSDTSPTRRDEIAAPVSAPVAPETSAPLVEAPLSNNAHEAAAASTAPSSSLAGAMPKIVRFETLARCGDEIWIENDGQIYRLRRTRQGKLILTK